jgi:hypothetical protein
MPLVTRKTASRLCVRSFLQVINDSKDPVPDQLRTEIDQQSQTKVCQPKKNPKKKSSRKGAKEKSARRGRYLSDPFLLLAIEMAVIFV